MRRLSFGQPTNIAFSAPPKGVVLTDLDGIRRHGGADQAFAVIGRHAPRQHDHITDLERAQLGAWIDAHQ